jgi:hypothetical protein
MLQLIGTALKASLLPIAITYWLLPPHARAFLDVPCFFTAIFGIHCPGCGMKSAVVDLLNLEWRRALATNSLSPAALLSLAWVSASEIACFLKGGVTSDRIFSYRAANDDQRAVA